MSYVGQPVGEGNADYGEHEADHQHLVGGTISSQLTQANQPEETYQEGAGYLGFKLCPLHHLERMESPSPPTPQIRYHHFRQMSVLL